MTSNYPGFPNSSNNDPGRDTPNQAEVFGQHPQNFNQPNFDDAVYDQAAYDPTAYPQSSYPQYPYAMQGQGGYPQTPLFIDRPGAWMRFLAYFIDSLLASIFGLILCFLIFWSRWLEWFDTLPEDSASSTDMSDPDLPILLLAGGTAVLIITWFLYRVLMEVGFSATLGKMIIGAKVCMEDGSPVTFNASMKRNSWYCITAIGSFIPLVGSLVNILIPILIGTSIANDPQKQSFFDKFAETIVIKRNGN